MSLLKIVNLLFWVWILFAECAQCQNIPLTPFGAKVRSLISDETYNKTFNFNPDNINEFDQDINAPLKNFYQMLNLTFQDDIVKELDEEDESLGVKGVSADAYFHAQTYAIARFCREKGILTNSNFNCVAQKFADELTKAAQNSKDDDPASRFNAMTTAAAKFWEFYGVSDLRVAEEYFIQELKLFEK